MTELLLAVGLFIVSLVVLLKASDMFTDATVRLGLSLGVSPYLIGATVVAGGTSLPELVSSVIAAYQDAPAIVVGNVVGSNIANILVVLGLAAVVGRTIHVERELMRVDLPLLLVSALFLLIAVWNTTFVWYEGVLALIGMVIYVHFTLAKPARLDETVEKIVLAQTGLEPPEGTPTDEQNETTAAEARADFRTYATLVGGLILVFVSAGLLVEAIIDIATTLGVGTGIVALTAVGLGTSLPEIGVSIAAVRHGDPEIAVGNVVGSNVFNSFAVMGIPSLITPLAVPESIRSFALPAMILVTVLYFFVTQDREITRWEGAALLLLYTVFLLNLIEFG